MRKNPKKQCEFPGCLELAKIKGLCGRCYRRLYYRKAREERRKAGMCTICGCTNDTEHKICSKCKKEKKISRKSLNEYSHENNLCAVCGKTAVITGTLMHHKTRKRLLCEKHYFATMATTATGYGKNGPMLKELFEEQRGLCAYTGEKLTLGLNASVDHFVPKVAGGSSEKENLRWVLWSINKMKFKYSYEKFVSMCAEVADYCDYKETVK